MSDDYEGKTIALMIKSIKKAEWQIIIGVLTLILAIPAFYMGLNDLKELIGKADAIERNSQDYRVILISYNLKLADLPEEEGKVLSWLSNSYSGYPTLLESLQKLLKNKRLKLNAVPLNNINKFNLAEHGKSETPITSAKDIKQDKLKAALLKAWNEKNSGTPARSFLDIIE